jgi:restriction system protein
MQDKMFESLIASVKEIDLERNYWFVRTDSGLYFETYINNNFIGIGWNEITVHDLINLTANEAKAKLADVNNIDLSIAKGKSQVTSIYNKLQRFQNLKKNDVIVIPSSNSSRLAFGIITDNIIQSEAEQINNCVYFKRRKVQWMEVKNIDDLDPVFYQIKVSRHAISNINSYSAYIDAVTEVLYRKNNYSYYVLDITAEHDINIRPLISLVDNLQHLLELINKEFNLNEDTDESSIKLNLQSPGKVIIKLEQGTSLIILAVVIALTTGCKHTDLPVKVSSKDLKKIDTILKVDSAVIDSTVNDMNIMEVDLKRLNRL